MRIEQVKLFTAEKGFSEGALWIKGNKIKEIVDNPHSFSQEAAGETVFDGKGGYLIPGMIDLHFHGCMGYDFSDGTLEAIDKLAAYQLSIGVTAICPAVMTVELAQLKNILETAARYQEKQEKENRDRATLVGINMEGPMISSTKCGAQNPAHIQRPSPDLLEHFLAWSKGLVKILAVAPEQPGAMELIEVAKDRVLVSVAHSNASYEQAMKAFSLGASHGVHLYNGMSPLDHKAPGIVGAVYDHGAVSAELICDGVHLHPATVRLAAKLLGKERMVLVSDSMRGTGLAEGRYLLGDLAVEVKDNRAVLADSEVLAGSVTTLPRAYQKAVKEMGIPLEIATAAVTHTPARLLRIDDHRGHIRVGYEADLLLLDDQLTVQAIWKSGQYLVPDNLHQRCQR